MTAKNTFRIILRNNLVVTAVSFILGKDKEASNECQYFNSESENEGTQ